MFLYVLNEYYVKDILIKVEVHFMIKESTWVIIVHKSQGSFSKCTSALSGIPPCVWYTHKMSDIVAHQIYTIERWAEESALNN